MNFFGTRIRKYLDIILKILVIIYWITEAALAWASDAHIKILEKGTRAPVENAAAVISGSDDYRISDSNGIVVFDGISFPVTLKVLAMGFETVEIELKKQKSEYVIYIEPLAIESESIEVTAERVKEKTSKIALTIDEAINVPATQGDPIKSADSLPGIVSAREGTGMVFIAEAA